MTIETILWLMVIAFSAGTVTVYYNSRFLGGLVRALLSIDAISPQSAISAEEIHIKITPPIKFALRPGTSFSQTVLITEDGRYYIAPDKVELAKAKYRGKDTTIVFVLIVILILVLFALAASYVFPELFDFVGDRFGNLFS